MTDVQRLYDELQVLYREHKQRYGRFMEENIARGKSDNAKELFSHLCYNLLLARVDAGVALDAITYLKENKVLFNGSSRAIEAALAGLGYRFPNRADWICENRARFFEDGCEIGIVTLVHGLSSMHPADARNYLADNIKGLGMKAASHFLRGLGLSYNELAILDTYILGWLAKFRAIEENEATESLTKKRYLDIERRMKEWNNSEVHIPLDILDLLLWEMGRGDI